MTVATFVRSLLLEQRPVIVRPDGRPLYGYRVQDHRYDDLRERIRVEFEDLLRSRVDPWLAAGFVLYAAETWRRSADIDRWNDWDVVLGPLGRREVPRVELYEAVQRGLAWWDRPLQRLAGANRYLATLVCEGGLPLHLVQEKGTPFRRYFRTLIAYVRDFGVEQRPLPLVAEQEASILPRTLQQAPVYTLAASLVEQLWGIHRKVKDRVGDAIELLDAAEPSWRDRLPLRLDDGTARGLFRGLIEDVRDVVANRGAVPRVRRWLHEQRDGWVLRACIEVPSSTAVIKLANLLGDDPENVPSSFRLALASEASIRQPFGSGFRHAESVQFEVVGARRAEVEGDEAAGAIDLVVDADGGRWLNVQRVAILGGQRLSPQQPWVFRQVDDESGRALLLADGGCRTRHEVAWVALPEGLTATPEPECVWERLTTIATPQRTVFRCRGTVALRNDDGDEWTVSTGQGEDQEYDCVLTGGRCTVRTTPDEAFVGSPRVLLRDKSGTATSAVTQRVAWRPAGKRGGWQSDLSLARGSIDLRVSIDGETCLRRTIAILPPGFDARIASAADRRGRIHLRGTDGAAVTSNLAPEIAWEQRPLDEEGGVELTCTAVTTPPSSVGIRLDWPETTPIDLVLPAPFKAAHFVTADGTRCSRDYVALDDLFAMRAVVVSPGEYDSFVVTGRLRDRKGVAGPSLSDANRKLHLRLPLRRGTESFHEAELRHLVEPIRRAMRAVPALDLQVQLRFEAHRGADPPAHLEVQRYAGTLHLAREGGWVELAKVSDPLSKLTERIGVRVFPLWLPGEADVELGRLPTPEPTWLFDPGRRQAGPWLVYGHVSGVACTRPILWVVDGSPQPTALNAHQRAVLAPRDQQDAVNREMHQALRDGVDEDAWSDLSAVLQRCDVLPATAFDTVQRLVGDPTVLILCLLRAQTREAFDAAFGLCEELPFDWALLPLAAWLDAWRMMLRQARTRYEKVGLEPDEVAEHLQDRSARVLAFLPQGSRALRLLAMWARASCGSDRPLPAEVVGARDPQIRQQMGANLDQFWMELRHRHAREDWPTMHGISTWVHSSCAGMQDVRRSGNKGQSHESIDRAPWVAACLTLSTAPVDQLLAFELQTARAFDAEWFDHAHERYLAFAISTFVQQRGSSS